MAARNRRILRRWAHRLQKSIVAASCLEWPRLFSSSCARWLSLDGELRAVDFALVMVFISFSCSFRRSTAMLLHVGSLAVIMTSLGAIIMRWRTARALYRDNFILRPAALQCLQRAHVRSYFKWVSSTTAISCLFVTAGLKIAQSTAPIYSYLHPWTLQSPRTAANFCAVTALGATALRSFDYLGHLPRARSGSLIGP